MVRRPLLWPLGSVVAARLLQSMWRNFFPLSLGNLISLGEEKQAAAKSATSMGRFLCCTWWGAGGRQREGAGWGTRPGGLTANPAACSL